MMTFKFMVRSLSPSSRSVPPWQFCRCAPLLIHLTFQLEKDWKWNMTMRHFFYFCWPNRSRLLNTGWAGRIKQRSRQAGGCYETKVWHTLRSCVVRNWNAPLLILCTSLHFSLYLTPHSVSHHISPLLNLFYLSIAPSNLPLSVFLTNSFPIYTLPLDGLFRFLMSLYLALLDRRNVSFYPEQHFSCHLGHFSPSATFGLCLICASYRSFYLSASTSKRFIMTY